MRKYVTGRFPLFVLLLFPAYSTADHALQTDWSGGPGVLGPVEQFGSSFESAQQVAYSHQGLVQLSLQSFAISDSTATYDVCAADLDGDGDIDVLGGCFGKIAWWENENGVGTDWTEHFIDSFNMPYSVIADDVDNDSDLDVIALKCTGDTEIAWWENQDGSGTVWTKHSISVWRTRESIVSDDFDSDGYVDVLSNRLRWYENPGSSDRSWTEHVISTWGEQSVCSADFNGDGYPDIVGCDEEEFICWINQNGSGTSWSPCTLFTGTYLWSSSVCAEDLDGDGDNDFVNTDKLDRVEWFENDNGLGTSWTRHVIQGSFNWPRSVSVSDIDSDGYQDILLVTKNGDTIVWLENEDGSAASWTYHLVAGGYDFPWSACSGDLDDDGYPEVIGASPVTWWSVNSRYCSGSITSSILYLAGDPQWTYLDWTSTEPQGTSVALQVRSSDDFMSMGEWSDTLSSPGNLSGVLQDYESYVQYRVFLDTDDNLMTPVLDEVMLIWNPLGLETGPQSEEFTLCPASANPAAGSFRLGLILHEATILDIGVFDVSGRLVYEIPSTEYQAGYQQIELPHLPGGFFFCRVASANNEIVRKFNICR